MKLFYDDGAQKQNQIEEYKENYKRHSKWLEYPPDYIEMQFQKFEMELAKIKQEAIQNGIDIQAV